MIVENIRPEQYEELLIVWENSVRATHDFITEEDIDFFKPIILEQAFPAVVLKCIKGKHGEILGFVGVHENKVEMLFVSDEARGQGVGKKLLQFAIEQLDATQVDVNEQKMSLYAILCKLPSSQMAAQAVIKVYRKPIHGQSPILNRHRPFLRRIHHRQINHLTSRII